MDHLNDDEEEPDNDDVKITKKCPCGEDAFTQYTCEFCGQTTCAYCDTIMKPCLGCGRLVCHDCTEETMSIGGQRRKRICCRCAQEMDKSTFDSYWAGKRKGWKELG